MKTLAIDQITRLPEFERTQRSLPLDSAGIYKEDSTLYKSLSKEGIQEALIVSRHKDNNKLYNSKFILSDGYRRLRGIEELRRVKALPKNINLNALPVVFTNLSPLKSRLEIDNKQIPNAVEIAQQYKYLIEHGEKTKNEIAQSLGKDASTIENYLMILKCLTEIQELIVSEKMPIKCTRIFSKLTHSEQSKLIQSLFPFQRLGFSTLKKKALELGLYYSQKRKRNSRYNIKIIQKHLYSVSRERKTTMAEISVAEKESPILEEQNKIYTNKLRHYCNIIELWLRRDNIKQYINKYYPDIFIPLCAMIKKSTGEQVK